MLKKLNGKQKNILVAEDDTAISGAICQLLKNVGYKPVPVMEGSKIIMQVKKILPHLVLLDVTIPGVNGYEICRSLKDDKTTSHVPIIIMSAGVDIKKKAKAAGANDSLEKPFDITRLIDKVEQHLLV
jgi:DNA-binding response OmpR family regulator